MQLGDFLKKEVIEKIKTIAEPKETSAEKSERLQKYEKEYFHSVDEMLDYMRKGGTIVPTINNSRCREGYELNSNGEIVNTEMLYTYFNTPLCVRQKTLSETEFRGQQCFKYKDEGYIMFWKKDVENQ